MHGRRWISVAAVGLICCGAGPSWSAAQGAFALDDSPGAVLGTGFTYQGRLTVDGVAANGSYDFRFRLYTDAVGGMQVSVDQERSGVTVTRGLFAVMLDFGNAFSGGQARWLGIEAGTVGGTLTPLDPRQAITPTPYSLFAQTAGGPWTVSGSALTYSGGNVGIGTASPAQKLHVSGGHIRLDTGAGLVSDHNAQLRTDTFGSSWHFFPGSHPDLPTPSSAVFWSVGGGYRTDIDKNADILFDAQRGVISRQGAEMRTGLEGRSWQFYPGPGGGTPSSAVFWNALRNKRLDIDYNANIVMPDNNAVIRFGSECFRPVTTGGLRVLGLVSCP